MKRKSVTVPHIELQQNLHKRFWDTWEIPLMTLWKHDVIVDTYGWKPDVPNGVCETVDGTRAEVRL
jgi:hypothetical protein